MSEESSDRDNETLGHEGRNSSERMVEYLSDVLEGFPDSKLLELVDELRRKFEIYGPVDLAYMTHDQLESLKTPIRAQKRKFIEHVKKIQANAEERTSSLSEIGSPSKGNTTPVQVACPVDDKEGAVRSEQPSSLSTSPNHVEGQSGFSYSSEKILTSQENIAIRNRSDLPVSTGNQRSSKLEQQLLICQPSDEVDRISEFQDGEMKPEKRSTHSEHQNIGNMAVVEKTDQSINTLKKTSSPSIPENQSGTQGAGEVGDVFWHSSEECSTLPENYAIAVHSNLPGDGNQQHSSSHVSERKIGAEISKKLGAKETRITKKISIFQDRSLREGYQVYRGVERRGDGPKDMELAVKIYHIVGGFGTDSAGEDSWFMRYRREVDNLTKLPPHTNIVQFMGCGKVENSDFPKFWVSMRLYHKVTLADINIKSLKESERLMIFLQICHGVKHLHDNGVAHRDLKPSNILFHFDGKNAVVTDFGLSKNVDIKHEDTQTTIRHGSFGGTLGWSPVEMLQPPASDDGDHVIVESISCKADIFSLGLVGIFIMCERHHPFANPIDPTDLAMCHTNIKLKENPDLEPLKSITDGLVAEALFKKMLNHKTRPDINQVLQHCLFWDCSKKVQFFKDMHRGYLDQECSDLEKSGTCEQKMAYEIIAPQKNEEESNRVADSNSMTDCSTQPTTESGAKSTVDETKIMNLEPGLVFDDFSSNSKASSSSGGSSVVFPKSEEDKKQAKMLAEIQEVTGTHWLDKIQTDPEYIPFVKCNSEKSVKCDANETVERDPNETVKRNPSETAKCDPDEKEYQNTLADLIRYIRNYHEHRLQFTEKRKAEKIWRFFSRLFPKLLPYLYDIMEPAFGEEDEATANYKQCMSKAGKIDVQHLLENPIKPKQGHTDNFPKENVKDVRNTKTPSQI